MLLLVTACHGLLDVSNPTIVQDQDIANASGAAARRYGVIANFDYAVVNGLQRVAMFTDERTFDARLSGNNNFQMLDQRNSEGYESLMQGQDPHLGAWDYVVTLAAIAIPPIRAYAADSARGDLLAQLYALRGYAIVQMAEDVCPGFPINDVTADNRVAYSGPYTTDSAFRHGMAQLDSAIKYAHDSVQFLDLARVVKGRALLGLGRYTEAAAAVAGVPADFVYNTDASIIGVTPPDIFSWTHGGARQAVGNHEGGNGLLFVSAGDVRVTTALTSPVVTRYADSTDTLYYSTKYPNANTPTVVASGVEARLIRAEVALRTNDATWLDTLNALRATVGLAALAMPASDAGKVDVLFSERAFWLYLTGRRLGDLRRLIRNYGRAPETVFPTGLYPLGGTYQGATAIPFVFENESRYNPLIKSGCTTR